MSVEMGARSRGGRGLLWLLADLPCAQTNPAQQEEQQHRELVQPHVCLPVYVVCGVH